MVSNYQLARLSEDVYTFQADIVYISDKGVDHKWQRQEQFFTSQKGFSCALYERINDDGSKDAVLAFRGTDDLMDVLDDVNIARSGMPRQAITAINIANDAKVVYSSLVLTGHSLGGALAIIAGAHANLRVVTFNAPGVLNGCVQSSYIKLFGEKDRFKGLMVTVKACITGGNVENIRAGLDLVSMPVLFKSGRTTTIKTKCSNYDFLCQHEIKTVVDSLSNY
jgi:hypothetical protein